METVLENCFVVYKRAQPHPWLAPEMVEEPLAVCGTYAEARQILDDLHRANMDGVIRFQGATGAGD
jgi:hypothetical protein